MFLPQGMVPKRSSLRVSYLNVLLYSQLDSESQQSTRTVAGETAPLTHPGGDVKQQTARAEETHAH